MTIKQSNSKNNKKSENHPWETLNHHQAIFFRKIWSALMCITKREKEINFRFFPQNYTSFWWGFLLKFSTTTVVVTYFSTGTCRERSVDTVARCPKQKGIVRSPGITVFFLTKWSFFIQPSMKNWIQEIYWDYNTVFFFFTRNLKQNSVPLQTETANRRWSRRRRKIAAIGVNKKQNYFLRKL